ALDDVEVHGNVRAALHPGEGVVSGLLAVLVDELDERLRDHRIRQRVENVDQLQGRAGCLGHDPPSFCDPSADDRQIDASDYARDMQPSTAERMLTSRCAHPISWSRPTNGSG